MPRISTFYGIVIYMNWLDHDPPHFHAVYGGDDASIRIDPPALLRGGLPPRALAMVLDWTAINQAALMRNWAHAQAMAPLVAVPPLP